MFDWVLNTLLRKVFAPVIIYVGQSQMHIWDPIKHLWIYG